MEITYGFATAVYTTLQNSACEGGFVNILGKISPSDMIVLYELKPRTMTHIKFG